MGQLARASVEIQDFPGLVTRIDPDDVTPGGAVEQVNVSSLQTGELRSRSGYRPVTFEEE